MDGPNAAAVARASPGLTGTRAEIRLRHELVPVGEDNRLDAASVDELYRRHAGDLLRFLRAVLRNEQAAQDVLQTTFLRLTERGADVARGPVRAWLFQVAYREAAALRRRQSVADRLRHTREEASSGPDPLQELVRQEQARHVRELIEQLPEPQRVVVEQRIYHEKTFAQIASEQGVPLGTVLTRMRLALSKLREALRRLHETDRGET